MIDEPDNPLLELQSVSRSFPAGKDSEKRTVIEEISLRISRGKIVVLLGPSGCGKSTVLRLVAGLIRPTTGKVLFDGKEVASTSSDRCMVFQDYACFPFLTVEDNISFGMSIKDMNRRQVRQRTQKLLESMDLVHLRRMYPGSLSGGERQRVAIARSLAVQPKLLLMDEPFSSLDGVMRRQLQDLILTLSDGEEQSCFFVTHSVEEAVYLGSVIYVMSAGPTETRLTPSTVIGEISVSFSRPRTQEIKASREFEEIERRVNELLRKKAYEAV